MSDKILEEKADTIEIKEAMKGSYYSSLFCIICTIILMIIITIVLLTMIEPGKEFIGYLILIIFWPVVIAVLIWLGLKIRGGRKLRRFVISKESILFEVPTKPTFKIGLSDFNTVEVSRTRKEDLLSIMGDLSLEPALSSGTTFYKFHFIEAAKTYIVESQKDYSRKGLIKIRAALEQLCQTHGKTYIFKKR